MIQDAELDLALPHVFLPYLELCAYVFHVPVVLILFPITAL